MGSSRTSELRYVSGQAFLRASGAGATLGVLEAGGTPALR